MTRPATVIDVVPDPVFFAHMPLLTGAEMVPATIVRSVPVVCAYIPAYFVFAPGFLLVPAVTEPLTVTDSAPLPTIARTPCFPPVTSPSTRTARLASALTSIAFSAVPTTSPVAASVTLVAAASVAAGSVAAGSAPMMPVFALRTCIPNFAPVTLATATDMSF